MVDPMTLATALVCAAICVRLIAFRRGEARHRVGISYMAWVVIAATGCQALASLMGLYQVESPFVLVVLVVLCVQVFRARGNLASVIRTDWQSAWNGRDRRKGIK